MREVVTLLRFNCNSFSVFLLPLDMRRILLSGSHLLSTKEMFEDNYDILKLLDHLLNSCFCCYEYICQVRVLFLFLCSCSIF